MTKHHIHTITITITVTLFNCIIAFSDCALFDLAYTLPPFPSFPHESQRSDPERHQRHKRGMSHRRRCIGKLDTFIRKSKWGEKGVSLVSLLSSPSKYGASSNNADLAFASLPFRHHSFLNFHQTCGLPSLPSEPSRTCRTQTLSPTGNFHARFFNKRNQISLHSSLYKQESKSSSTFSFSTSSHRKNCKLQGPQITPDLEQAITESNRHARIKIEQIQTIVSERSKARWDADYKRADELKGSLEEIRVTITIPSNVWVAIGNAFELHDLKNGDNLHANEIVQEFQVAVTDVPRSQGGESKWELIPTAPINQQITSENSSQDDVLHLAHATLGMAVSFSERGVDVVGSNRDEFHRLVERSKKRLYDLNKQRDFQQKLDLAMDIVLKILVCEFANSDQLASFGERELGEAGKCQSGVGELHGRKAADAALWFALAGVASDNNDKEGSRRQKGENNIASLDLYDELVHIATEELLRFGSKSSCRPVDVLHIAERVAMAGIVGPTAERFYAVVADCLEAKNETRFDIETDDDDEGENNIVGSIDIPTLIRSLRSNSFGLHSEYPLLGLWKFSTRQRKQRVFFQNALRHFDGQFRGDESNTDDADLQSDVALDQYDWKSVFEDPTRPLVVDVGCGMGVSLLGLASMEESPSAASIHNVSSDPTSDLQLNYGHCNFVGVDLSRLAIGYAKGVSQRWNLGRNLKFIVDSAEECLTEIYESYPGKVKLVMVQFPTPFRLQSADNTAMENGSGGEKDPIVDNDNPNGAKSNASSKGFNAQLPQDAASGHYMVTETLLSLIHKVLSDYSGTLLLQSNCEDVAVHMKNTAISSCGFESIKVSYPVTAEMADERSRNSNIPKRAQDWIAMGGERAIGDDWSARPLLPLKGRTETEVACLLDNKPVHRCWLVPKR